MIDMDDFYDSCKAYQDNCNHEEIIVRAIVQRLWEAEQGKEKEK